MKIRTNQNIKVLSMYDPNYGTTVPQQVTWSGREHRILEIASYRARKYGTVTIHQYLVTDGTLDFHLSFDSETLAWKLYEVDTVIN
ncbi:MAG: hypothetical protein NUV98_01590 [Candidatus Roizmanbacteria bacterium]|nr:hypothetical protein [Candidatus Roizmanbacteria bacterium]